MTDTNDLRGYGTPDGVLPIRGAARRVLHHAARSGSRDDPFAHPSI